MKPSADIQFRDARKQKSRAANVTKWAALATGGALAVYGLTRRSPLGLAIAAGGGALAYFSAQSGAASNSLARSSVLLNCPPERAYSFWRNFENLPLFMHHLESVTVNTDGTSHWVALGPLNQRVQWTAEIVSERENELIAWRSLPDSDITLDGMVEFRKAPADRGTVVSAAIAYEPPAGKFGDTVAFLMSKHPSFLMRQDLRRLKALIEAGEIPTTEGQSHGPRTALTAAARIANPDRPLKGEARMGDVMSAQRRIS